MPFPSNQASDITGHCWRCGAALTAADYGRENACPGCGRATRCCRNCRCYERGRPNDCIEPMAEEVADKQRANFCEFFDPANRPAAADNGTSSCTDRLRAAAEALFK